MGLLDAFGLARAHIVGMSMGGELAQMIAIEQAERVETLTLIATSLAGPAPDDSDLPPPSDEFLAFASASAPPDWSDRDAVIDYLARAKLACVSRNRPIDEADYRAIAARVIDRTIDVAASLTNHFAMADGAPWQGQMRAITAPTLVIHGEDDPVFLIAHGETPATEIPGARLLRVARMGHEVPESAWDELVPAILEQTRR